MSEPNSNIEMTRPTAPGKQPASRHAGLYECFDWLETFLVALVSVILIFTFLFRVVTVVGTSMIDTLKEKDYLIISNLFYKPETGDIVVIQAPNYSADTPLIKRVIATGGQYVDIDFDTWEVRVGDSLDNMVLLDESYVYFREGQKMRYYETEENYPIQVEENCVFVMGDNRNGSLDSRDSTIGQINTRYILGHAVLRLFPFHSFGTLA